LARPTVLLGAFAILLLVLLIIQIYADLFRLTPSSLTIVVLIFGVVLVLSYPDITKFKVGPSGFEFERQAHELTQKLLAPTATTERTATITSTARIITGIEPREPDSRGALFTILVDIEREMARFAGLQDTTRRRLGFGGLIGALTSRELLDQDLHEALEFLRKIRNSAFHGEYLTEDQTKAALNLATIVLARLKAIETPGA